MFKGCRMNGETAQQFAYRLRAQGQQDANVIFAQLAEGFFGFRLKTGYRVFTLDDAVQFLYELAEAVKYQEFPEGTKFPESTKVHQMPEKSSTSARSRNAGRKKSVRAASTFTTD